MTTNFRPYPLVTVRMNRYGHLELWRGGTSQLHERDCDLYVQLESDVKSILRALPQSESEDIDNGWNVSTYFISDEYFAV